MDSTHPVSGTLPQALKDNFNKAYPNLVDESNKVWCEIVNSAGLMTLPADSLLMDPKTPCMQYMLVIDGCVRVYQQTPNDKEVTLYRTHGGELCVLSINGLIKDSEFGAYARSETEVTGLTFSRDQFLHAMANYQPFLEFILVNLTERFNDVLALMEETAFESLESRLMCALARFSKDSEDSTLNITHQDLARELGTSREVISRLLKGFEKQGCIELGRGVIRMLI